MNKIKYVPYFSNITESPLPSGSQLLDKTDEKIQDLSLPEKFENLINDKKGSNWERIDSYGNVIGLLIEHLPDIVDEASEVVENKLKSPFIDENPIVKNILEKAKTLIDGLEEAPALLDAANLIVMGLLAARINEQIVIYQKDIEKLGEKEGDDQQILKLKLKINGLKQYKTKKIKDAKPKELDKVFEKAMKTLTPILPNGAKNLEKICSLGAPLFEVTQLTALSFNVTQKYEAIQLLNQMKEALEKERKELEKGDHQDNKKKIDELELKIEDLQKKIFNEEVKFTAEGIQIFSELMKGLALVLPENAAIFLKMADTLKLISKGIDFTAPVRKVIERVKNIRDLKNKVDTLNPYCSELEATISALNTKNAQQPLNNQDFNELYAKKNLLVSLRVKQNTIRDAWIPMEVLNLAEDALGALSKGQKITKALMSLLGIAKLVITAIGTAGLGLTVAAVLLKVCAFFLNDIASFKRWKASRSLAADKKSFERAAKKFNLCSTKIQTSSKADIIAYCEEEILKLDRLGMTLFQDIQKPDDLIAKRDLQQKRAHLAALKDIFESLREKLKGQESISAREVESFLQDYKNNLLKQKASIEDRESRLEEDYQKRRKLELLGLSDELYLGFKNDLAEILKHPAVKNEFSAYIKQEDKDLEAKIFDPNGPINMDLLVDFFIPPIKT